MLLVLINESDNPFLLIESSTGVVQVQIEFPAGRASAIQLSDLAPQADSRQALPVPSACLLSAWGAISDHKPLGFTKIDVNLKVCHRFQDLITAQICSFHRWWNGGSSTLCNRCTRHWIDITSRFPFICKDNPGVCQKWEKLNISFMVGIRTFWMTLVLEFFNFCPFFSINCNSFSWVSPCSTLIFVFLFIFLT